jgi:hypothetical protein
MHSGKRSTTQNSCKSIVLYMHQLSLLLYLPKRLWCFSQQRWIRVEQVGSYLQCPNNLPKFTFSKYFLLSAFTEPVARNSKLKATSYTVPLPPTFESALGVLPPLHLAPHANYLPGQPPATPENTDHE